MIARRRQVECGVLPVEENNSSVKRQSSVVLSAEKRTTNRPASSVMEEERVERLAMSMPKRLLVEDLEYLQSPSCSLASNNVVIVMDALKDFSTEALEWALDHIIKPGSVVALIGAMPWLNFILSSKTWLDVWTLDLDDLYALRERTELRCDNKYQKIRTVLELCEKYGVVPNMKVAMGEPLRLVVLERIISLHAAWVVFDRHHRKDRSFYAKRLPCNMVMMNGDGDVEILKVRPMIRGNDAITPGASPTPMIPPSPKVIISKELMEILKSKEQHSEKSVVLETAMCI